ncbi:MAG: hypothetical protein IT360_23980, partial [Gemmatimonadaceae bacterium]|nr:hypothetical protein [Gemmatimonadaceae bacterium]
MSRASGEGELAGDGSGAGTASGSSASAASREPTQSDLRDLLHALHEARHLEPIDEQLADMIVRRGDEYGARGVALAVAAACASRARREGHSAVALDQLVHFARLVEGALASPVRSRGEPRGAVRTVPLADHAPS